MQRANYQRAIKRGSVVGHHLLGTLVELPVSYPNSFRVKTIISIGPPILDLVYMLLTPMIDKLETYSCTVC